MKTLMADIVQFKMLHILFLVILIVNESRSATIVIKNGRSCGCYDACTKNFTTNSIKDVQKIASCQRGCRFYSLVLHTSHERNPTSNFNNAKESCHLSCEDSYKVSYELSSCKYGCSAGEMARARCISGEQRSPKISYSLLIEESDVLIHPGEPDPEDALMDPGLRKQFDKTLEALFDRKSKLPEIHFRNLPIRNDKPSTDYSHINLKCPKFYGFDSKFEFRNGKIIIGDLYLFVGVFVFVVICFILGHHIEARSMAKQLAEAKISKAKEEYEDRQPLLGPDFDDPPDFLIEKEPPMGYTYWKSDEDHLESVVGETENKFEDITLVFHDDGGSRYSTPPPPPFPSQSSSSPPLPPPSSEDHNLKV